MRGFRFSILSECRALYVGIVHIIRSVRVRGLWGCVLMLAISLSPFRPNYFGIIRAHRLNTLAQTYRIRRQTEGYIRIQDDEKYIIFGTQTCGTEEKPVNGFTAFICATAANAVEIGLE